MGVFLISYTIIALLVLFVIFVLLVSRRVIFKHNNKVQSIFAHPLLIYSLRRMGSAFISIMLAITATYLLIRLQSREDICSKLIPGYTKLPAAVKIIRCDNVMDNLGLSGSALKQLFTYYYKILPFPKTLCAEMLSNPIILPSGEQIIYMEVRDCRNFIMDLGKIYNIASYKNQFVIDVIFQEKMPHSFKIGIIAVIIELGLGYPMGIMMAKHKDGWFDKLGNAYIISIDAIPGVAYYFIWMSIFMAIGLPIRYASSDFSTYLAPSLTLGLTGMAGIALWVRRFMLEEFNSDYVKFARAKGLSENRIMFTHVLRNAIVPLIRSIPAAILGALLGTFYIEQIYNIPGLGNLLIMANDSKDFWALQGVVVISALISIVSYLLGDLVTAIVDPRVSFSAD